MIKLLTLLILFMPAQLLGIETSAKYALLIDYETDTVLYEKNADEQMYPSSMSKLMTIYIVFDMLLKQDLTLEQKFIISKKSWQKQGSKMFVKLGSEVSIADLLNGVIVQSGNDACIALAEGISGSEEDFAQLMNNKAQELGLLSSHFVNSTGWPDPEQLMSARDLAILAKRLIHDFPEYYHLFSLDEFVYNNIKQQNRNVLLARNFGVDGLKTGHTDVAGYGITVSAKQGKRRLILVVNGLPDIAERAAEAERLLKYGFLNFRNLRVVKKNQVLANVPIWMGKAKTISLMAPEDFVITLPRAQQKNVAMHVAYETPIKAPIKINDKIGELTLSLPGNVSKVYPILANKDVPKLGYLKIVFINLRNKIFGKKNK